MRSERPSTCILLSQLIVLCGSLGAQELPPGVERQRTYPHKKLPDQIVAEVGATTVSREEFHKALVETNGIDVLRELIKERVIQQEAAKAGIHYLAAETDQEVKSELAKVRQAIRLKVGGERPSLEELLASRGRSMDSFLDELRHKVEIKTLLDTLVLLDRLDTARVEIRIIQVRTRQAAESIQHRLAEGADFAKLAGKESIHRSGEKGGHIEPFARGLFHEEYQAVEDAAFALRVVGETTPVIQVINAGNREEFFILKLVRQHPPVEGTFATLREQIADLRRSNPPGEDEIDAWLGAQLDNAPIFIDPK